MPREYRHIKQYENELLDLRNQGLTYKEIADRMGFNKKQIQRFFERYRIKQRKTSAGQAINKKGRPCKKDNELMRDFLSLIERKKATEHTVIAEYIYGLKDKEYTRILKPY